MANLPALTPTTFAEALQFADALAKSTMVPREYQRQPANILVAIQWGAELGLGPLQALQSIAVINGKPAVYGDAMLALVRGSPLCLDVVEKLRGEGDARMAICEARRRNADPVIGKFSIADAKRAGLWDKSGPWKQYPERMLQMRARGFALRDAFPDVLRGIISAEEAADIPREPKDVTPQSTEGVTDALDAFATDTPLVPETAPQQPLEVPVVAGMGGPAAPTEGQIDMIEAVLAPEEVGVDMAVLLAVARTKTFFGYDRFRTWYSDEITDDQRYALRPHIRALRDAARKADEPAPSEP